MRILIVLEQYLVGGLETHIDALVGEAAARGDEVFIASGPDFRTSPVANQIRQAIHVEFRPPTGNSAASGAMSIADLVRQHSIDLVHLHPFRSLVPGAVGALLAGVPYTVTIHGPFNLDLWPPILGGFLVQSLASFVLPNAAMVFCVSEYTARDLSEKTGYPVERIRLTRNPIDASFLSAPDVSLPSNPAALFVSRLDIDKIKGVRAALTFLAQLKRHVPELSIRVAGGGGEEVRAREIASSLGLPAIEWLGERHDIARRMTEASIVVGSGRVSLEAAAAGRACVLAGTAGVMALLTPTNFKAFQASNYVGYGLTPHPLDEIAAAATERIKHQDQFNDERLTLRRMVADSHSSAVVTSHWMTNSIDAAATGVTEQQRASAQSALEWLRLCDDRSLSSLEWYSGHRMWPETLLGPRAGAATIEQLRRSSTSQAAGVMDEWRDRLDELTGQVRTMGSLLQRMEGHALNGGGTRDNARTERDSPTDALSHPADLAKDESQMLRAQLQRAERVRASVLSQAHIYRQDMEDRLKSYRGQRAWALMLATRVVYTAFIRRGTLSALDACRAMLFQPSRWQMLLKNQDLEFPDISNYFPAEAMTPFDVPPPTPEECDASGLCELPLPRRQDLVIFAIIDFEFRYQRPQQIAAEFARRGHRVFWISPTRVTSLDSGDPYQGLKLQENLWEIRLKSPAFDIYRGELTMEAVQEQLQSFLHLARDFEISSHALLVQIPFWRRLAVAIQKKLHGILAYDCMDEWDAFENISHFIRSEEPALVRESDAVIVTATKLANKFEQATSHVALVRNGADYSHFHNARPHKELEGTQHPVVGYFGAIADWIDLGLIEYSAQMRPQYTFVLVGQVFDRDVSGLESLPNVRMMGGRPYSEIPSFLASFDVCTIPFLVNDVTAATDPVKLYEYFCSGKPVVATKMNELEIWGDAVYTAESREEYVALIDRAVNENNSNLREERRQIARSNTWSNRVATIADHLASSCHMSSIVVVTYNSADFIKPCLDSISAYTDDANYEVIVVDNASTDDTVAIVSDIEDRDPRVKLIRLSQNTGFAAGNNRGVEVARGEFLVLLNADTMVTPGWLHRLRRHLQDDASIGLICPVTNHAGNEARVEVTYRDAIEMEAFARRRAQAFHGQRTSIPMVPLFCGALSAALYREVGGLDESYGIGMFEDDDFSQRIRLMNKSIVCAEDCFVHHFGQGSFGGLQSDKYEQLFRQNKDIYEARWKTTWSAHTPRNDVRPAHAIGKFQPSDFTSEWYLMHARSGIFQKIQAGELSR